MARVLNKYIKLPRGAAPRSMFLTALATFLGIGAFVAIAMEGGNLEINMPNGPNALLWTLFLMSVLVAACYALYVAIVTSKGERIEEPVKPGPSAEDTLQPAHVVTRRSETEVVTTRRDETVSLADRNLAENGERKPTDLLKRREGDPDPAHVADAGRLKAPDKSRDERSQTGGDRRNDPPKPPPAPQAAAPAQPAAQSVTATATATVEGDGAKKPEKVT